MLNHESFPQTNLETAIFSAKHGATVLFYFLKTLFKMAARSADQDLQADRMSRGRLKKTAIFWTATLLTGIICSISRMIIAVGKLVWIEVVGRFGRYGRRYSWEKHLLCFVDSTKLYQRYISLQCSFNDKVQCIRVCHEGPKHWRKAFPQAPQSIKVQSVSCDSPEMKCFHLNPWPLLVMRSGFSYQQFICSLACPTFYSLRVTWLGYHPNKCLIIILFLKTLWSSWAITPDTADILPLSWIVPIMCHIQNSKGGR